MRGGVLVRAHYYSAWKVTSVHAGGEWNKGRLLSAAQPSPPSFSPRDSRRSEGAPSKTATPSPPSPSLRASRRSEKKMPKTAAHLSLLNPPTLDPPSEVLAAFLPAAPSPSAAPPSPPANPYVSLVVETAGSPLGPKRSRRVAAGPEAVPKLSNYGEKAGARTAKEAGEERRERKGRVKDAARRRCCLLPAACCCGDGRGGGEPQAGALSGEVGFRPPSLRKTFGNTFWT